jgi:hypothetical protein
VLATEKHRFVVIDKDIVPPTLPMTTRVERLLKDVIVRPRIALSRRQPLQTACVEYTVRPASGCRRACPDALLPFAEPQTLHCAAHEPTLQACREHDDIVDVGEVEMFGLRAIP